MLPEWPEPQLPTPSPNANEGGRQKLIVNAEGVASKTGDTRGKFTGSPGPAASFWGRRANEGGRQKLIVNAKGVASKTGDTRGKFTGSPGPAASFRGHGANKHARKMLTHSLYICVLLFATKKLYIIFHAYDVTMF